MLHAIDVFADRDRRIRINEEHDDGFLIVILHKTRDGKQYHEYFGGWHFDPNPDLEGSMRSFIASQSGKSFWEIHRYKAELFLSEEEALAVCNDIRREEGKSCYVQRK